MELTSLQNGRYKIESILGQGGFGITYRAVQTSLGRTVAIKEFFMKDYCERAEGSTHVTMGTQSSREMVQRYRDKFEKEARTLARLKHPHIIPVIDVFQENNTSYYVMEYAEGASLKQQVDEKGPLSEARAVNYILQVADALRYLHGQHICHLDIKPANILTTAHGEAILADFGLAKQYDEEGGETSTTPVGKSKGYAPPEQYRTGGVQSFSPETDVYALGATLYFLLTGKTPPESVLLNEQSLDVTLLSPRMAQAVQAAMQLRRADRVTLDVFEKFLTKKAEQPKPGKDEDVTIIDVEQTPSTSQTKEKKSVWSKYSRKLKTLLILTSLINVAAFIFLYFLIELRFIEVAPLCINLVACYFLYKGWRSGYWGLLSMNIPYILYGIIIYWICGTSGSYSGEYLMDAIIISMASLFSLCLLFALKKSPTYSSLIPHKIMSIASICVTIGLTCLLAFQPYFFQQKYGIKHISDWSRAVSRLQEGKESASKAEKIVEDYQDASKYFDYFYKDPVSSEIWKEKVNKLKKQGKY